MPEGRDAMLMEELESLSRNADLYRDDAACPECGEHRGFGTHAAWTRCRFCLALYETGGGQADH